MRTAAAVLALGLVAAPALAQYNQAPPEPRECRRLTNQIVRYQGDLRRAHARNNALWERAMAQEIEHLNSRRIEKCPQYARTPSQAMVMLAKAVDVATKAAWKYFTWQY